MAPRQQQRGYDVEYCTEYNPRVTVYQINIGWAMQVEGVNSTVRVTRVR